MGDSVRYFSQDRASFRYARLNAIVQVSSQDDEKVKEFFCIASPFVPVDAARFLESETELRNVVLLDQPNRQVAFPADRVESEQCVVQDFQQPAQYLVNYYWRSISRFRKHASAAGR